MSVDIKQLFEAGAHFGHQTHRWNPKMAKYIFGKKDGIHIINLENTVVAIEQASKFLNSVAGRGKQVLFIGTSRQSREVVKTLAEQAGQPYVTERWLGGMLTNSQTIFAQVKKLKMLEKKMASGELANRYSKLEVQRFQEDIDAMNARYSGIKEMRNKPGAIVVTSAVSDKNAIAEARKLNIPVIAICDSNADPSGIDYVVPANDDAIGGIKLIIEEFVQAVKSGANVAEKARAAEKEKQAKDNKASDK